jgi:hypothetical protein
MAHFHSATGVGVWQTLLVMAAIYAVFMMAGAFGYRVPPDTAVAGSAAGGPSVHVKDAHRTAQFWLLWGVLCLNVSAGIGVLEMASPMLQEIFGGRLIGAPVTGFSALSPDQKVRGGGRRRLHRFSCRCSTSWGGFSGPRCRTASVAA